MTAKNLLLFAFLSICLQSTSFSQQLIFSAEQSYALHDSIAKSRWDWGGAVSDYSFRHMSEFFPVSIIEKPETALKLQSKIDHSIADIVVKENEESITFEKFLRSKHVSSIIILHRDTILFEQYYGMLPDELHTLQSVSKVVTSALIAKLENEKRVDISKPVETYLPELKGTGWEGVSVKNILYMRSGMEGAETIPGTHPFTDPKNAHYKFEAALGVVPKTDSTPNSVYKYIASLKRAWTPGEKAEYNSVNTFVLGWIAEKITGIKYADLVTEMIWKPMGASSNAYVCLSNSGVPCSNAGVSATLKDLARFGILFTKSDIVRRKENIISYAQIDKIQHAGGLGYQWEWAEPGEGMMKSGFGGQGIFVNPDKDLVIAWFNFINDDWRESEVLPVVRQVQKALLSNGKF